MEVTAAATSSVCSEEENVFNRGARRVVGAGGRVLLTTRPAVATRVPLGREAAPWDSAARRYPEGTVGGNPRVLHSTEGVRSPTASAFLVPVMPALPAPERPAPVWGEASGTSPVGLLAGSRWKPWPKGCVYA